MRKNMLKTKINFCIALCNSFYLKIMEHPVSIRNDPYDLKYYLFFINYVENLKKQYVFFVRNQFTIDACGLTVHKVMRDKLNYYWWNYFFNLSPNVLFMSFKNKTQF